MSGDISRDSFRPDAGYTSVRHQQGRLQLDADLNEQADIAREDRRRSRVTVVGRVGVRWAAGVTRAEDIPDFKVSFVRDDGYAYIDSKHHRWTEFKVGAGELHVDGVCVPNAADKTLAVNSFTDGDRSGLSRKVLVVVDTWEREIDALQDPRIREVALEGPDTCTRTRAEWRLHTASMKASDTVDSMLAWGAAEHSRMLRMQPRSSVDDDSSSSDPCLADLRSDGLSDENTLIRVALHRSGLGAGLNGAKWARDNASVVAKVTSEVAEGGAVRVGVDRLGSGGTLGFQVGDLVEVLCEDWEIEKGQGLLVKVQGVGESSLLLAAASIGGTSEQVATLEQLKWARRNGGARLVRWDGFIDLSSADGEEGYTKWASLEGLPLQLRFEVSGREFKAGAYWTLPLRALAVPGRDGSHLDWPKIRDGSHSAELPTGPTHRYAALAELYYVDSSGQLTDWGADGATLKVIDRRAAFRDLAGLTARVEALALELGNLGTTFNNHRHDSDGTLTVSAFSSGGDTVAVDVDGAPSADDDSAEIAFNMGAASGGGGGGNMYAVDNSGANQPQFLLNFAATNQPVPAQVLEIKTGVQDADQAIQGLNERMVHLDLSEGAPLRTTIAGLGTQVGAIGQQLEEMRASDGADLSQAGLDLIHSRLTTLEALVDGVTPDALTGGASAGALGELREQLEEAVGEDGSLMTSMNTAKTDITALKSGLSAAQETASRLEAGLRLEAVDSDLPALTGLHQRLYALETGDDGASSQELNELVAKLNGGALASGLNALTELHGRVSVVESTGGGGGGGATAMELNAADFPDLQAAIEAAQSTGKALFLPKGSHYLSYPLRVGTQPLTIRGEGAGSRLHGTSGGMLALIELPDEPCEGLVLQDLALDGSYADTNRATYGVWAPQLNSSRFERVVFSRFIKAGAFVARGNSVQFTGCRLTRCEGEGVFAGSNASALSFTGCRFDGNRVGAHLESVQSVSFLSCSFDTNLMTAITLAATDGVQVQGCFFRWNGREGFPLTGGLRAYADLLSLGAAHGDSFRYSQPAPGGVPDRGLLLADNFSYRDEPEGEGPQSLIWASSLYDAALERNGLQHINRSGAERPFALVAKGAHSLHRVSQRDNRFRGASGWGGFEALVMEEGGRAASTEPLRGPPSGVDVRHFGARGDGRSDDTAALQAAVNHCQPRGLTLRIPKGDYLLSAPLSLGTQTFSIVGDGVGSVVRAADGWSAAADTSDALIQVPDGANGLQIRDLRLDADGQASLGMGAFSLSNTVLSGLSVQNGRAGGIRIQQFVSSVTVKECSFRDNEGEGLFIHPKVNPNSNRQIAAHVLRCAFDRNLIGLRMHHAQCVEISACNFTNQHLTAVAIDQGKQIVIRNSDFRYNCAQYVGGTWSALGLSPGIDSDLPDLRLQADIVVTGSTDQQPVAVRGGLGFGGAPTHLLRVQENTFMYSNEYDTATASAVNEGSDARVCAALYVHAVSDLQVTRNLQLSPGAAQADRAAVASYASSDQVRPLSGLSLQDNRVFARSFELSHFRLRNLRAGERVVGPPPALVHLEGWPEGADVSSDPPEQVDARLFGARGDNSSDDTDALQEAIEYCQARSVPLKLSAGVYRISRPLVVHWYGLRLLGDGPSSCVAARSTWSGGENEPLILMPRERSATDSVRIEGIRLSGGNGCAWGLRAESIQNFRLVGCKVQGMQVGGVYIYGVASNVVRDCVFWHNVGEALFINGSGTATAVQSCDFRDNGVGVRVLWARAVDISGCAIMSSKICAVLVGDSVNVSVINSDLRSSGFDASRDPSERDSNLPAEPEKRFGVGVEFGRPLRIMADVISSGSRDATPLALREGVPDFGTNPAQGLRVEGNIVRWQDEPAELVPADNGDEPRVCALLYAHGARGAVVRGNRSVSGPSGFADRAALAAWSSDAEHLTLGGVVIADNTGFGRRLDHAHSRLENTWAGAEVLRGAPEWSDLDGQGPSGDEPPTAGSWSVGQMVRNRRPGAGAPLGWICVGPEEWVPFGVVG